MKNTFYRQIPIAIAILLCGLSALLHADAIPTQLSRHPEITAVDYLGFRVEDKKSALRNEAKAALIEQLQIVQSARVPDAVLGFFKSVPIIVDPSQRRQPGKFAYRQGLWAIFIEDKPMLSSHPIVLHELLHAYHLTVSRTDGRQITAAYKRAIQKGVFPAQYRKSHFLDNEKEYFAIIGSIYLHGDIHQPPFNCAIVKEKTPEFLELLARHFGSHDCQ